MKATWILLLVVLAAASHSQEKPREISGRLELPVGAGGFEATLSEAISFVRSNCDDVPGTSPYIERVFFGPTVATVDDGLMLEFRCIADSDVRLKEPGRDARRGDAGKGIVERAMPVETRGPFGWDLTYGAAFDAAGVPRNDTMRKLFRDAWLRPPYVKHGANPAVFEGLKGADTAVLIDFQVRVPIYGGHQVIALTVRGAKGERRSIGRGGVSIQEGSPERIRELAQAMLTYVPTTPDTAPRPYVASGVAPGVFVDAGYIGVVSVSSDGQSRQFLVTEDDLSDDANKVGGLARLLAPVLSSAH